MISRLIRWLSDVVGSLLVPKKQPMPSGNEKVIEAFDTNIESHLTPLGVETTYTIKATLSGWVPYALLRFKCLWNNVGTQITCTAVEYWATDNDRSSGNVIVQVMADGSFPWSEELTTSAAQDEEWHELGHSKVINVQNHATAIVAFTFIYDIAGKTSDPRFVGQQGLPYKPPPPRITTGTVTDVRDFVLAGEDAVPGATIDVYGSDDRVIVSVPANTSVYWSAGIRIPESNTLTVYTRQSYMLATSDKSNVVTIQYYVAGVSIESPKTDDVITVPTPTITGKGHSGARIDIYKQDGADGIYGTGTVVGTSWSVKLTKPLANGEFIFRAEQVTPSGDRKWSNTVPVTVQVKPATPVITQPAAHSEQNRSFTVSGTGGEVGAIMRIYSDLGDVVVGTLQSVTGNAWSVPVVILASVPPGEVRLAAQQTLGVPSDRSEYRSFKIKPPQPSKLMVQVDAQGKVTLGGVGHIGATFYLHVANNGTPFHSFTVTTSPWTEFFPDWLPGTSLIGGRQSVPDVQGLPIYSDYTPENTSVAVPVPPPTLRVSVSTDGIPTFSGTGRNWSGLPASRIEVRLEGTSSAIVPIVDVRADTTWSSTAAARWAPGTYSVTATQWFATLQSEWVQPPVSVVISAPPAVIEKVTPNGLFAKVVGQCWPGAELTIKFSDNSASHPVADTDRNGQWDFQRSTAFRPGRHTVTVTQTFGGQTSNPVSMAFEIVVSVLVITPPPGGQTDHLPVLHGTGGIDGFTISVLDFVTHDSLGEVLATGDAWSVQLRELDYLSHTVFAIQVLGDLQSLPSNSVTFKVVLFAPTIVFPTTRTSVPRTFTVEGYARAGKGSDRTEVDVYLDGVAHRVYPHYSNGYFKQTFKQPLGPCVLKARQYFKDQDSPLSQDVQVTIIPDKAHIETPGIGEAVGQTVPTCGFGFPEDNVVVALLGGEELKQTKVDEDGNWFCWIEIPGTDTDVSLVTEQRKGEYRSGWSEPRPVRLLAAPPTFDEPEEGKWEGTTPEFAGRALDTSQVEVVAWYNADEKHGSALVANGGRWTGIPERDLPAGPQWARAVQVVGGKRSMPADSKRFEVAPSDEPPRRHPTSE